MHLREETMHATLLIGDLIRATEKSADTIRRWSSQGFLKPVRDSAGRRIFSRADLDTARRLARRTTPRLRDALAQRPPEETRS